MDCLCRVPFIITISSSQDVLNYVERDNPLYTEQTLPHYILEEPNFNFRYVRLCLVYVTQNSAHVCMDCLCRVPFIITISSSQDVLNYVERDVNPLYTEQTLPHYILEEPNFNFRYVYIFLEKNGYIICKQ